MYNNNGFSSETKKYFKKMGYFPAYVNLLKTAVGSGILAYPYLFLTYGILPTLIISTIAAFFSFFGLALYIESTSFQSKIKEINTLSSLATSCSPNSKIISDLAICFKCFSVAISYLIIARQLLPIVFFSAQVFLQALLYLC